MKRFTMGSLVFVLGCVTRYTTVMDRYVGRDESAIVADWGVPEGRADLPNGNHVLTWEVRWHDETGEERRCRRNFTFAPSGKALSYSLNACPRMVQR